MLFLHGSLVQIQFSLLSSHPAVHRHFTFKTLLMLGHSYRKLKSLELQPAGRARYAVACSRLLATNCYVWSSKSSLLFFCLFVCLYDWFLLLSSLSKPVDDFAAHLFQFLKSWVYFLPSHYSTTFHCQGTQLTSVLKYVEKWKIFVSLQVRKKLDKIREYLQSSLQNYFSIWFQIKLMLISQIPYVLRLQCII